MQIRVINFVTLLILAMLLNGCASAIYSTGKDGDVLRAGIDRAVIIQRFGQPIARGTDKFGHDYEVFRAKGKIAPAKDDVATFQMSEAMTLGLGDIIWTPELIVWSPFLATGDKDVIVLFDKNGKYLYHTVQRAKPWTQQPDTALEPGAAAPSVSEAAGNPKAGGEPKSTSDGGGSTLDP
ncbi:MAG: hypothetical protein KGJ88_12945 [Verrucomicrobiota bacterium]|nr:hypothetical protein [Verrucomicrobiota bacterium]